ncbi:transient receptor potential cation channel subfamily a member 1-like [Gigaspora margarita]|uniref:Transient receptor potential cation channel subfamily a member 1-like n=1 Tax=Gigaspora margarita TaxID=4874 RepID=A0A8H3XEY8_GIGMA|nr:transient receptor potential cation channel subfamily a member 1-like [Gigaspora margarita]
MNNEGESSQVPKFENKEQKIEIESEPSTQTKPPKPTKLPDDQKIESFLLSPDSKYAVAYSRKGFKRFICGWQLDQDQPVKQTENESYQPISFKLDCLINLEEFNVEHPQGDLVAVSNNKLVAIVGSFFSEITVLNLAVKKKINLKLYPYSNDIPVIRAEFYNNEDFVMLPSHKETHNYCLILKGSFKNLHNDKQSWTINNSISCGKIRDVENHTINKEKLLLLDKCGSLTQWNLNTLSIEKTYQLDMITNYHVLYKYIFNKGSTLLAVCLHLLEGATFINGIIYIYSVENSMLLSQCQIIIRLRDFRFISSDDEERLLYFYYGNKLDIRDPYNLQHVIENESISNLYKELLNNEALTTLGISCEELMDEKIYYMLEGCLWVQKISKKQWIEYLQKRSQGFDKIRVLPKKSQIEKILQKLISEGNNYTSDNRMKETKSYDGSLVKWEVNGKENVIQAFKKSNSNAWEDVDSIKLEHFSMHYSNTSYYAPMYICSCDLLHNDDLAVITSFGLFIWSTWQKDEKIRKIRVLNYMSYGKRNSYLDVENSCFINLLNKIQKNKKCSLPAPDFDFLYERKQSYIEGNHRLLLKELLDNLLDDYIEDNILMKLYIQELLEFCLKFQLYSLAERLCNKICSEINLMKLYGEDFLKGFLKYQFYPLAEKLCNKICEETEKDNFLEKIQLLDILTFSFEELTQYPQLLKKCLSYTLFIHSASNYEKIKFNKFISEPHLQSHIKYLHPYFTSNIIEKIRQPFILLDSKIKFSTYIKNIPEEIEKIFYKNFQAVILIFPFPKFSSYPATYNFWEELIFPKLSIFSKHQFPELYKYWCGEALLNFKWNTYGKYYFFAIFVFYLIFMLSFLIAVTIEELSNNTQNLLLIITIIFGSLHLTFEIRQFILFPLDWITEIWNYFDIGAILFPVLTSINLLQSSITPIWAITISILLLELKFITFFRAIEFGGTHWAMIIGVIKSSLSFFVIIGLIMFAFAHSLHILLRQDNLNNSEESNTNMFINLDTAYLAVYMMLTGDTSSVSNWSLTENLTLTFLIILFSFFTTIYLMNLFIGLLSDSISNTNKKELFLFQKAKIISEIELFYMLPHQRRKNNWFPELL